MKPRCFNSKIAPYIEGFISEKRKCGYSYDFHAYILENFDRYVINSGHNNGNLEKKLVEEWAIQRQTESYNYRIQRVRVVKLLAQYMISIGIDAYIPVMGKKKFIADPYILSLDEISKFLKAINNYNSKKKDFYLNKFTYNVLFRLYICTGLRLSEAINLKKGHINFENNTITVLHSKGDKDRKVFMSEDISNLCKNYDSHLSVKLKDRIWFFSLSLCDKKIHRSTISSNFANFWRKAGLRKISGKNPTVHSLRHTYVVFCINKWLDLGLNITTMMPYLSNQLGHNSVDGTYYYYHTTLSTLSRLKKIDNSSNNVIPQINSAPEIVSSNNINQSKSLSRPGKRAKNDMCNNIIPKVYHNG
jgi:integrase